MKEIFYKYSGLFSFIPLHFLIRITRQHLILPFYHLVSDSEVIHIKHLYRIRKIKDFEKDLDYILKVYHPISISEIIESLKNGKKIRENSVIVTFDDGLREFGEIVVPILLKKGIPAACFLNNAFIDNRDLFFRYKASILIERMGKINMSNARQKSIIDLFQEKPHSFDEKGKFLLHIAYQDRHLLDEISVILDVNFKDYLMTHKPYLSSDQINTLIKKGFMFGSHSFDHPLYSELLSDDQLEQTVESVNEIVKKYNLNYRLFSFPFTDDGVSKNFFNDLFEKWGVDLTFGTAGLKNDVISRNLQRIPMEIGNYSAREILYGEYFYFILKSLVNQNSIKR